ncbi:MAG: F0F1 ATP synthase subunit B [Candidatus Margulisiibacteriota bacterium]
MVEINFFEIFMQIVNFLIVLFLLQRFLYKPVMTFMANRQRTIAEELHRIKKDRTDAEEILEQQKELLVNTKIEAQDLLEKAQNIARSEQQDILNKAREEALRLIANARAEINDDIAEAKKQLVREVGSLAVQVAAQVLQKDVAPASADKYVKELEVKLSQN